MALNLEQLQMGGLPGSQQKPPEEGGKEIFVDMQDFTAGLHLLFDTTKAPFGSLQKMRNVMISDRGGLTNRPGRELLGTKNTQAGGCVGFFNYSKAYSATELLMKGYLTELEYYHPQFADWTRLKNGFTSGKEFGFKESLINTENEDYVYFCNRYEPYQRWQGAITQANAAVAVNDTSMTVKANGLLKGDALDSQTATASSATTLTVSSAPWVANQWNGFYVKITSGALSGKIRKISATTTTVITFSTLGSDPGSATFEIWIPKFPDSGTIIYNGSTVAYSALDQHNVLTISAAPVTAVANDPVALVPTVYNAAPRGNRLEIFFTRMLVGNVRSALALSSGGVSQGSASAGSFYVSKLKDPTDFTYSATRVAGEGDVVATPYGGGDITDIANYEDKFLIFKPRYIEKSFYDQLVSDNDILKREQVKQQYGSVGKVVRGKNDLYFVTANNEITSIKRVLLNPFGVMALQAGSPQIVNVGLPIKRKLDGMDFTNVSGAEFRNRILIAGKTDSTWSQNNEILVYNQQTESWEGEWDLGAFGFAIQSGKLYYAESVTPNAYQLFPQNANGAFRKADLEGATAYPVTSEALWNYFNLAAAKESGNSIMALYVEGYISENTTITIQLWKDFQAAPFLSFDFAGTETAFTSTTVLPASLGVNSLGLQPLGTIGPVGTDGRKHFWFIAYFPFEYLNYIAPGVKNSGTYQDWEITRWGFALGSEPMYFTDKLKSLPGQ